MNMRSKKGKADNYTGESNRQWVKIGKWKLTLGKVGNAYEHDYVYDVMIWGLGLGWDGCCDKLGIGSFFALSSSCCDKVDTWSCVSCSFALLGIAKTSEFVIKHGGELEVVTIDFYGVFLLSKMDHGLWSQISEWSGVKVTNSIREISKGCDLDWKCRRRWW